VTLKSHLIYISVSRYDPSLHLKIIHSGILNLVELSDQKIIITLREQVAESHQPTVEIAICISILRYVLRYVSRSPYTLRLIQIQSYNTYMVYDPLKTHASYRNV